MCGKPGYEASPSPKASYLHETDDEVMGHVVEGCAAEDGMVAKVVLQPSSLGLQDKREVADPIYRV